MNDFTARGHCAPVLLLGLEPRRRHGHPRGRDPRQVRPQGRAARTGRTRFGGRALRIVAGGRPLVRADSVEGRGLGRRVGGEAGPGVGPPPPPPKAPAAGQIDTIQRTCTRSEYPYKIDCHWKHRGCLFSAPAVPEAHSRASSRTSRPPRPRRRPRCRAVVPCRSATPAGPAARCPRRPGGRPVAAGGAGRSAQA
jgi:hypothetical protein